MTKADSQSSFERPVSRTALLVVGAVLLILMGFVLQLDMLGYGHFNTASLWFVPVIAEGLWNAFAARLGMPTLDMLLRFWPLVFVCSGLAILLSRRAISLTRATSGSRVEGNPDA